MKLLKNLEYEAEIYADITFGPKTLTMLITAAMQFGEKFFDCSIGNVIYLKAEINSSGIVVSVFDAAHGNEKSVPVNFSEARKCSVLIHYQ